MPIAVRLRSSGVLLARQPRPRSLYSCTGVSIVTTGRIPPGLRTRDPAGRHVSRRPTATALGRLSRCRP